MALMVFEDARASPLAELMEMAQRQKTASELNSAILSSQSQAREPKLPSLIKMLVYAQGQLDERVAYPRMNDLVSAELVPPAGGAAAEDQQQ
jgi:hypothetical protein